MKLILKLGKSTIYAGRSEREFHFISDALAAAGIKHDATAYNTQARLTLQSALAPAAPTSRAPSVNPDFITAKHLSNKALDRYFISVKNRHLVAATKAIERARGEASEYNPSRIATAAAREGFI